ncbi:MAG: hypothetical protein GX781_00285 [Clostridiales bacterium]|nr:hypothetical protein [Clostridiales bacterium]
MNQLELLKSGGVVGGGGAGFPAWKKFSAQANTLLINGAECEPLLKSDQYLMLYQAETLVRAARSLGDLISANQVKIALKEHYHVPLAALQAAVQKLKLEVSIHALPSIYPVGDEQSVVYECTGEAVPPRGLPGNVGCTVVSVSTAINALHAFDGIPVTRRLITVAGEVKRPGLYDVPVGTFVSDVISAAGGMNMPDACVLLGGPMMGELLQQGEAAVVTKTCGGILVFPKEHLLVNRAELSIAHMRSRAKTCCIQCRYCTDLCPRFLLGHPIYPHLTMRSFAMDGKPEPSAVLCMECGICELFACPMGLSPRRIQQLEKEALCTQSSDMSFSMIKSQQDTRLGRQVPSQRMAARVDVDQYEFDTPQEVYTVAPGQVNIPLKQHIGVSAKAAVSQGEHVRCGQVIGIMQGESLGAYVHASIDGVVGEVSDAVLIIGGTRL